MRLLLVGDFLNPHAVPHAFFGHMTRTHANCYLKRKLRQVNCFLFESIACMQSYGNILFVEFSSIKMNEWEKAEETNVPALANVPCSHGSRNNKILLNIQTALIFISYDSVHFHFPLSPSARRPFVCLFYDKKRVPVDSLRTFVIFCLPTSHLLEYFIDRLWFSSCRTNKQGREGANKQTTKQTNKQMQTCGRK